MIIYFYLLILILMSQILIGNVCGKNRNQSYYKFTDTNSNLLYQSNQNLSKFQISNSDYSDYLNIDNLQLDFPIDNESHHNDVLSFIGIIIFLSLNIPFLSKFKITNKLLSLSWLYIGYYYYIIPIFDNINENKLLFWVGISSIIFGMALFSNFVKFFKSIVAYSSFFNWLNVLFTVLFSNNMETNSMLFGFTQKNNMNSILFTIIMTINTIPLLFNSLINNYINKTPVTTYPSLWILISLSSFVLNFREKSLILSESYYFFVLEIIFYNIAAFKLIGDLFSKKITFQTIIIIIITLLNVFLSKYWISQELLPNQMTVVASFQGFIFREHTLSEAGIDGFFEVEFFYNKITNIFSNNIYEIDFMSTEVKPLPSKPFIEKITINSDKHNSKFMRKLFM